MAIAYLSILAAAVVPYSFIAYAKMTRQFFRGDHNKNPREYEEALHGARKRAYWAQLNGFEAFPPFAAAVLAAIQAGVAPSTIEPLALAFVAIRVVYGLLYVANLDKLRTVAWFSGMACVVALFFQAATVG